MAFQSNFINSLAIITILSISIQAQIVQPGCNVNDKCSCKYEDGAIMQLKYLGEYMNGYMTVSDTKSSDTFDFNPCVPFTVKAPCDNVVACQHHPDIYDIGSLTPYPPSFASTPTGDVKISYNDKSRYRSSEVTCICDESYTGMPGLTAQGEASPFSATFGFEMRHACCCKDVCKDGMPAGGGALSGGSILLILSIVLLAVYLIAGAIFMKYKKGAIGTEIIPNKNFWSDIPSLVKDGLMFILSPCTKRKSYDQV